MTSCFTVSVSYLVTTLFSGSGCSQETSVHWCDRPWASDDSKFRLVPSRPRRKKHYAPRRTQPVFSQERDHNYQWNQSPRCAFTNSFPKTRLGDAWVTTTCQLSLDKMDSGARQTAASDATREVGPDQTTICKKKA